MLHFHVHHYQCRAVNYPPIVLHRDQFTLDLQTTQYSRCQ
jgi:hypothetical protein